MDSNTEEVVAFIEKTKVSTNKTLADITKKLIKDYPQETTRQHIIRAAFMLFEEKYKPEMKQHAASMQELKETRENKFAADMENDIRVGFRIPKGLVLRIKHFIKEPDFLSEEAEEMLSEWEWFRKNFPRYVVPKAF